MPAAAKRTRTADEDDPEANARRDDTAAVPSNDTPDTATSTPPRRNLPRRSPTQRATPSRTPSDPRTPTRASTQPPPRPAPTREATPTGVRPATTRARVTLSRTPRPAVTRSASLFNPIGRGANSPAPASSGPSRGGVATATRAASLSAMPSAHLKETVAGGSGGPPSVKGGDDAGASGPSGRGFGKGKENIPPVKNAPAASSSSSSEGRRKRVRVSSRTTPSRGRSESVASVRSESASASGSFSDLTTCRTSSCLPSPSPSPSTATTLSFDHMPSPATPDHNLVETLDDDAMDVDRTPTRKGKQPMRTAVTTALITPPPSSPISEELAGGVEMISVRSRASTTSSGLDEFVSNPYRALKASLRLSAPTGSLDATIVGRDDEKAVLSSYVSLVSSCDVGMYVSGPPGTGKTALTTAVGRQLAAQGWCVAEVSVMGLRAPDVWSRLGHELGCGKSEQDVVAHLGKPGSRSFIILDEIDSLLPPAPALPAPATSHVLSKLFSLPLLSASGSTTVKLVAISNTLDLTVRANLVLADGTMPQVLPFRAYGAHDMVNIVNARVAAAGPDAAKVDPRAAELLCRKVEAQNGDLRMCLDVLSAAVGVAQAEWLKKASPGIADSDRPLTKVSLPHVLKAFASHTQLLAAAAGSSANGTASPTANKIRSIPLHGRMVLVALLVFVMRSRTGLAGCPAQGASTEDLTTSALYATYAHILSHETSPFPPSSESDYRDLLSNLETLGLVKVGGATAGRASRSTVLGMGPRVELCVREVEALDGLGIGANPMADKGMAEQEVARVWEREHGRVDRVKARAAAQIERAKQGLEMPH